MACEAIILPSLAYPLATAYLSEKEIIAIQRPYMSAAARVCGFNGNTSRAVLFGPRHLGGYGLTDLAAAQCWAQLDLLMHHMKRNDQAATLIRISLAWLQLFSGIERPILEDVADPPTIRSRLLADGRSSFTEQASSNSVHHRAGRVSSSANK